MQILPNISGSKGYQTMKLGQLIEYKKKIAFLQKSENNAVEKLFPDSLVKIQNRAYLCLKRLNFYSVCFYFMRSLGLSNCIET